MSFSSYFIEHLIIFGVNFLCFGLFFPCYDSKQAELWTEGDIFRTKLKGNRKIAVTRILSGVDDFSINDMRNRRTIRKDIELVTIEYCALVNVVTAVENLSRSEQTFGYTKTRLIRFFFCLPFFYRGHYTGEVGASLLYFSN